jgi:hypothetical protein
VNGLAQTSNQIDIENAPYRGDTKSANAAPRLKSILPQVCNPTGKAHGLLPFFWDNGAITNFGSAIFNRNTNTVFDQQALDALIEGAQQVYRCIPQ